MRMTILVACLWLVTSPLWGKIAFYSFRDGQPEIYTMDSDGTNQTRLTFNEVSDAAPSWSPNGQQIAFMGERDKNWDVYVMDADGGNQRRLTRHPSIDSQPNWSPDGSQIAFGSKRDGNGRNIFVMDANGGNVRQVTRMRSASRPYWSPDGKRILFGAVTDSGREVYMVDINGRNRWKVSFPNIEAGMFARGWSPDGTQILYTGFLGGLVKDSIVIIATLDSRRRKPVKHEQVPKPSGMQTTGCAWGTDGKSVLISLRRAGEKWDIYRFNLPDGQLIQLTNHPAADYSPREWNSRLPVSPRGLVPKRWGEIKSNLRHYRGNGRGATPPIP